MNQNTVARSAVLAAAIVVSLAGCERRRDAKNDTAHMTPSYEPADPIESKADKSRDLPPHEEEPSSVGGGPMEISAAVVRLAESRCDREQKCGNFGAGKKWKDRDACIADVKKTFADDLNADDCPAGVDAKELSECLAEIQNEDCKNPFDKLGRFAACRTSDICRHVK